MNDIGSSAFTFDLWKTNTGKNMVAEMAGFVLDHIDDVDAFTAADRDGKVDIFEAKMASIEPADKEKIVQRVLANFDDAHTQVVLRLAFLGKTVEEIAMSTDMTAGQVMQHLNKLR